MIFLVILFLLIVLSVIMISDTNKLDKAVDKDIEDSFYNITVAKLQDSYPGYSSETPTEVKAREDLEAGDFVRIKDNEAYKATPTTAKKKEYIALRPKNPNVSEDSTQWYLLNDYSSDSSNSSSISNHSNHASDHGCSSHDYGSYDSSSDCSSSD